MKRRLLSTIVPSMIAGGLLFGSAFGHAASGDPSFGFWPAASDVTAPTRVPPPTPTPPAPAPMPTPKVPKTPMAPTAPTPPKAPKAPQGPRGPGAGGGVQVSGIKDMVLGQLDSVRNSLTSNPNIPKDVRDKITARLDKVRASVEKRLSNITITDLDKLGDEMDKMGEEIEEAMEGLDDEMEKVGKDFEKNFGKDKFKFKFDFDHDDDDDDDDDDNIPMTPDIDADDDDMKEAISDLKDLALDPGQRTQITKLRTDSDKAVAIAKKQLDDLSTKLRTALANPATPDADVARLVDQISAQEAVIRKARILAWAQARRVLDDGQRKKVEDAAKKKTK